MHTTRDLIELAKNRLAIRHGLATPMTDYRLGKLLEIRQQNISAWQTGQRGIGTEFAAKFADACELPEAYVYACIEHERATDAGVQRILAAIAKRFGGKHAATLATGFFLLSGIVAPDQSDASTARPDGGAVSVYSVKRRIHRARARARLKNRLPGFREPLLTRLGRWLLWFPVTDQHREFSTCAA